MPGVKHLIECHCTLRIYDTDNDLVNHKFPVYSKLDKNGLVIKKLVKCNNCEAVHSIVDVCRSELVPGKDQTNIIPTIEEVSLSLPERLSNILSNLKCDVSTYEHCLDILEEERWDESVVLRRDIIDEKENLKILTIRSENKYKIQTKTINNLLENL